MANDIYQLFSRINELLAKNEPEDITTLDRGEFHLVRHQIVDELATILRKAQELELLQDVLTNPKPSKDSKPSDASQQEAATDQDASNVEDAFGDSPLQDGAILTGLETLAYYRALAVTSNPIPPEIQDSIGQLSGRLSRAIFPLVMRLLASGLIGILQGKTIIKPRTAEIVEVTPEKNSVIVLTGGQPSKRQEKKRF
jgi:hypothetical protein